MSRAIGLWYSFPAEFRELQLNGMRADHSWAGPAAGLSEHLRVHPAPMIGHIPVDDAARGMLADSGVTARKEAHLLGSERGPAAKSEIETVTARCAPLLPEPRMRQRVQRSGLRTLPATTFLPEPG